MLASLAPLDRDERGADARLLRQAHDRVDTAIGGKYQLERLLGVGSMAAVYAAVHLRNTSRVAVKVLHRELSNDKTMCSRFLREGYLANSVSHPATVRVLDDSVADDGSLFLVMELVEGETLESRLSRSGGKLAVAEVVSLLGELLDVLSAAHEKGIVHRDIKPENVSVTAAGRIKLLDFGIARDDDPSSARTMIGTVLGSPGFMSPEQALGRTADVDALSDIWSVGATAFTLLSGRLVHVGESANETLARAALMRAVSLSSVAPHVPPALAHVIDRALAFDKSSRWPSARAMREALRSPFDEVAPASVAPPPVVVSAVSAVSAAEESRWRRDLRGRRRRPLLLAGVALGLTGLAATTTVPAISGVWEAVSPRGLVSAAAPARSSGSSTLSTLLPPTARPAALVAARGDANPASLHAKELAAATRPGPAPALAPPVARGPASSPGADGSALAAPVASKGREDDRPVEPHAGDEANAGAHAAHGPLATWPDPPSTGTEPVRPGPSGGAQAADAGPS